MTPVPPELMAAVETTDLQSALGLSTPAALAPHRRTWMLAGAGLAAGLLTLYLARGSDPIPPPPPPRQRWKDAGASSPTSRCASSGTVPASPHRVRCPRRR